MAIRAQGTFEIDNWDENEILETDGGSKIRNAKVQLSGLRGDGTSHRMPHENRFRYSQGIQ